MQTNDLVQGKYEFRIIGWKGCSFSAEFKTENGLVAYPIPIYISSFGIRPLGFSFCVPGAALDEMHPDYYRAVQDGRYLDQMGQKLRIEIDETFNETGKYYLLYLDNSKVIPKFAQQKSEWQIEQEIGAWVQKDVWLDPVMLLGRIIRIVYWHAYSANVEDDELTHTSLLKDAIKHHGRPPVGSSWVPPPIIIVIQDEYSLVEYGLPKDLLTKGIN